MTLSISDLAVPSVETAHGSVYSGFELIRVNSFGLYAFPMLVSNDFHLLRGSQSLAGATRECSFLCGHHASPGFAKLNC